MVARKTLPRSLKKKWRYIYALVNPKTHKVFYIGSTTQPVRYRLSEHIWDTKNGRGGKAKRDAIQALLDKGKRPMLVELARVEEWRGDAVERRYIQRYREMGYEIVNRANGGRGNWGIVRTAENRAAIGRSLRKTYELKRELAGNLNG